MTAALIGVRMAPGAMLLTVMPSGASSTARLRISIFMPPLLAEYGAWFGNGSCSCTELMLMIRPPRFAARHWRTNAWAAKNAPFRLTSITRS